MAMLIGKIPTAYWLLLVLVACELNPVNMPVHFAAQLQAQETQAKPKLKKRFRHTPTLRPHIFKKLDEIRTLADDKNYAKALDKVKALEKLKRSAYEKAMTYNMYAYVQFNREDYAAATKAYEQLVAIEKIPLSLEQTTQYSLAKLYLLQQQYAKAIAALNTWEAIVEKPSPESFMLKAQAYYQLEQYQKALPEIKHAVALNRQQGNQAKENWLLLERAIYYQNKDYQAMVRCLQDLLVLYPKAQYWLQLSAVYSELNQQAKSLSILEIASDKGLLNKQQQVVSLAQVMLAQEQPYKSAQLLLQGMKDEVVEQSAKNLSLLGDALMLAKEYEQAIGVMEQAAKASQKAQDFYKLAQIYTEREHFEKAKAAIDKAFEIHDKASESHDEKVIFKQVANAYILSGLIHYNLNQLKAAKQAFAKASTFEKTEKSAQQWLKYLVAEQKRQAYLSTQ